jgi:hypothetical protein
MKDAKIIARARSNNNKAYVLPNQSEKTTLKNKNNVR